MPSDQMPEAGRDDDAPASPASKIHLMHAALMRAKTMLTEMRRTDFDCFTLNGDPASMGAIEEATIAEYDAVLIQIDGALDV